ncbi:hypothetical protein [Desulfosporosinus lacus]|uniref:hypothetical protein n=1 Tax=Desulfosporosinus lacus TaxID=329936 RepID=UPI0011605F07|nr:hypothetical protein [Desulfosporosinus lacus]
MSCSWEERFLHASARYAADVLVGSRARPNLKDGRPHVIPSLAQRIRNIRFCCICAVPFHSLAPRYQPTASLAIRGYAL